MLRRLCGLMFVVGCLCVVAGRSVAQAVVAEAQVAGSGSVGGRVEDVSGTAVAGVRVVLRGEKVTREVVSDEGGRFSFGVVTPGTFHLTVGLEGLDAVATMVTVRSGEAVVVPTMKLKLTGTATTVDVTATQEEIAEEEVHAAEKQRVFGVIPNYFVSYEKNPTPLVAKQKFELGLHVVLDPTHFVIAAAVAGIQQADDAYNGFGQGAQGFGKRYGAVLADTTSAALFRGSIYPALFHQDPRYFYKGTGTNFERAKYALGTAFVCKGDNGKWQPNYTVVAASFTSGALSNLYYAPQDRKGASLTVENALLGIVGVGFGHLMQEFVFEKITSKRAAQKQP